MATFQTAQHEYGTTRGLWCINRLPTDVDYEWIKRSAFELQNYLDTSSGKSDDPAAITIGRFTLKQAATPGKICMAGPSGEETEVDEKVLEDMLASFF